MAIYTYYKNNHFIFEIETETWREADREFERTNGYNPGSNPTITTFIEAQVPQDRNYKISSTIKPDEADSL